MVLNPAAVALSKMLTSSARCCSADKLDLDGQSMFATVATQSPRVSRWSAGGLVSGVMTGGFVMSFAREHAARRQLASAHRRGRVMRGKRHHRAGLRKDSPAMK
jgi:hypothetical protein